MDSDTKSLDCIEFRDENLPYMEEFTKSCFGEDPSVIREDPPVIESAPKLLRPSKKISRSKNKRIIARKNAEKLTPFFLKWKEVKKRDRGLKKQIKLWFSSFNAKLNKTYIYRQLSEKVRIHFRLAVRENGFSFQKMDDKDWGKMFLNLTEYLTKEVDRMNYVLLKGKKSQVYPVWIEDMNVFTIEKLPSETA